MRITTVRFRRLQSHDRGYGHDAVEAEAQVEAGETAEGALEALQGWVLEQLGRTREADSLGERLERLRENVRFEERRLDEMRGSVKRGRELTRQHEELAAIARKLGIKDQPDMLDGDDQVPF